jgi:hypothetical protein
MGFVYNPKSFKEEEDPRKWVLVHPCIHAKNFYRVAPSPTLCGKIVAPYTLLLPWTASIPYRRGMPKRVFRAARWKSSVMLSHNSGVAFGAGTLPPPLSILPA